MLAGCVVFKDKICIVGENSAVSERWYKEYLAEYCVSSLETFDPTTETWMAGPELPNPLCGAGLVKFGETLTIVGWEDDKSWMVGMCWLREDKDRLTWSEGIELPTVMSTFDYVVANMQKRTKHAVPEIIGGISLNNKIVNSYKKTRKKRGNVYSDSFSLMLIINTHEVMFYSRDVNVKQYTVGTYNTQI